MSDDASFRKIFGTRRRTAPEKLVMAKVRCMVRKLLMAGAAASLVAAPIAAQEAAVNARQSAPASGESALGGDSALIYLLGIAVVAASIVFLSEDDDPVSP